MDFVIGGVSSISTFAIPSHPQQSADCSKPSFGPYLLSAASSTLQVIVVVTYIFQDGSEYVNNSSNNNDIAADDWNNKSNHHYGWHVECNIQFRNTSDPFWGNNSGPPGCRTLLQQTFRVPCCGGPPDEADEEEDQLNLHQKNNVKKKKKNFHVHWPSSDDDDDGLLRPTLTLSSDHRSMACIIPSPVPLQENPTTSAATTTAAAIAPSFHMLLGFDIQQMPRSTTKRQSHKKDNVLVKFPKLPSYVSQKLLPPNNNNDENNTTTQLYFMAKHPCNVTNILLQRSNGMNYPISCCFIHISSSTDDVATQRWLLIGYNDGVMVLVLYYPTLLQLASNKNRVDDVHSQTTTFHHWKFRNQPIRTILAQSSRATTTNRKQQQIAILYGDGHVSCYCLEIVWDNNNNSGSDGGITTNKMALDHEIPLSLTFARAIEWVDDSRLAVLEDATTTSSSSYVAPRPRICIYLLPPNRTVTPEVMMVLDLNYEQFMERCHYNSTVSPNNDPCMNNAAAVQKIHWLEKSSNHSSILTVSTYCMAGKPFSFLWNWQTNVTGFTVQGNVSMMKYANGPRGPKLLLLQKTVTSLEKTIFDVAVSSASAFGQFTDPFLLSLKTIWLPSIVHRTPGRRRLERKWEQVKLPHDGRLAASSPSCIAVAGHFGLSVLHLSSTYHGDTSPASFRHISNIMKAGTELKKWTRYRNSLDEQSFRVIAMTLWPLAMKDDNETNLVVSIIESCHVHKPPDQERHYRLAIWPANDLKHSSQLAVSDQAPSLIPKQSIGIDLNWMGIIQFEPHTIQIVAKSGTGRAFLLLRSTLWESPYLVYQLELDHSRVIGKPISWGTIGAPAELFLAAVKNESDCDRDNSLAVLGVVRKGPTRGLDAMIVTESSIVAVGEVVGPKQLSSTCIASVLPYHDDDCDSGGNEYCSWCLRLGDGRLYVWTLSSSASQLGSKARSVHPFDSSLGFVFSAGTTRQWMMNSESGSSTVASLGIVTAKHGKGTVLLTSQAVIKDRQELMYFIPYPFGVYPVALLLRVLRQLLQTSSIVTNNCITLGYEFSTTNTAFCFQVLLLHAVTTKNASMVSKVVDCLKQNTTRIQFQSIILKIGRQLEGSYLVHLFPLPGTSTHKQLPVDLFDELLILGSSETAMQAIPLIDDPVLVESRCGALFHANLNYILQCIPLTTGLAHECCIGEAATALKALFQYSLKTGDDQDSSCYSDYIESNRYSMVCGVIPGTGRRSSFPRTPSLLISPCRVSKQRKISNGELLLAWMQYPLGCFASIPYVLARFCVSIVFQKSHGAASWLKLGLVATLTVTGTSLQNSSFSIEPSLLRSLDIDRFGALVGSITDFLTNNVSEATAVLSVQQASCICDLCSHLIVASPGPDTAGLILVNLVACFVANKEQDLAMLETSAGMHVLTLSLQEFMETRASCRSRDQQQKITIERR